MTSAASILHVLQPDIGGVPDVVMALAGRQSAQGVRVAVAAPEAALASQQDHVLPFAFFPWRAERRPGVATLAETRALQAIVAKVRPDVVHLHSFKAGVAGRLALRGRIPTIFQPHGWSFYAVRPPLSCVLATWERTAARWSHRIFCVSQGEADSTPHLKSKSQLRVVPNGIDPDRWAAAAPAQRVAARRRLGVPSEAPLVVCVGRLAYAKGQDVALAAWRHVARRAPDATLAFIGDGPDREALSRRADGRILLPGWVSEIQSWLHAADVAIQPSRWEAGLCLASLQALASGLPLVATAVNGSEVIARAGAGSVVPREDSAALAEAILTRLLRSDLRSVEGARGRALVERSFVASRCFDEVTHHTLALTSTRSSGV